MLNSEESKLSQTDPPAALQPPVNTWAAQHHEQQPPGEAAMHAAAGSLASELNAHMAIDQINSPQAR